MPTPQHFRRRQQRQDTRVRLLKAALGVFSRKGFEDTSVEDICLAAGYSKGGFYFHFKGKDELLVSLFEEAQEETCLPGGRRPSALTLELWSQAARKAGLRRLLSERYVFRRREFKVATARGAISRASADATVELLLALDAGLDIQASLVPAFGDVSRARAIVDDLLSALAAEESDTLDEGRRSGAQL